MSQSSSNSLFNLHLIDVTHTGLSPYVCVKPQKLSDVNRLAKVTHKVGGRVRISTCTVYSYMVFLSLIFLSLLTIREICLLPSNSILQMLTFLNAGIINAQSFPMNKTHGTRMTRHQLEMISHYYSMGRYVASPH